MSMSCGQPAALSSVWGPMALWERDCRWTLFSHHPLRRYLRNILLSPFQESWKEWGAHPQVVQVHKISKLFAFREEGFCAGKVVLAHRTRSSTRQSLCCLRLLVLKFSLHCLSAARHRLAPNREDQIHTCLISELKFLLTQTSRHAS